VLVVVSFIVVFVLFLFVVVVFWGGGELVEIDLIEIFHSQCKHIFKKIRKYLQMTSFYRRSFLA